MVMTKEKSYKIQVLRGLAIIAVVLIHNTPSGLVQVWCRPFLNFAVGLFLFMSGMLSNAEKWNPRKRIFKVVIPYVIWTYIYILLQNINSPAKIPVSFIKSLITANSSAVMYYIFIYCEFTLLIPFIDKTARSKYKYFGFMIAPFEIIFIRLIPMLMGVTINPYLHLLSSISCLGWFSYYYLGYMLGNKLIQISLHTKTIVSIWGVSILLQIMEGYLYFSMGEANCGTQLKITSILSGVLFALLSFRFIENKEHVELRILHKFGDASFGIYFSHLAVMKLLNYVPYYSDFVKFPINGFVASAVTFCCVYLGRNVLGKYAKYLAL